MFEFNAGIMDDRLRLELIKNGLEAAVKTDLPLEKGIREKGVRENKTKGRFFREKKGWVNWTG